MRMSQYFIPTLKEIPADAETISHQLMLRAGMIRKLAAGLYTWLPLGLRVMRKVEKIVREEMDRSGALEVLMPAVQPAELWQETDRWEKFGSELLKITDRHEREFCFGPTHEEVITDLARREIHSYKQLPLNLYQIQNKFRDEIRPRFGVMRAREFLMKDAYSFDLTKAGLEKAYQSMYDCYTRIFKRIDLKFRAVFADTGSIGGSKSQEFHVLAESGEDQIFFSDESDYAANVELAEALAPSMKRGSPGGAMTQVDTPTQRTCEDVAQLLKMDLRKTVKTIIVKGSRTPFVCLLLRGDHELNAIKAQKLPEIANPLTLANAGEVEAMIGAEVGFLGPIGLSMPVIADREVAVMHDFVCGANVTGKHSINVNWERDLPLPQIADLRKVVVGDVSPDGRGKLQMARGIEVGHVFQLGTKYSEALHASVLDEAGKETVIYMGSYGIGVTRTVAAAIEQNNDPKGIIWPESIAPFHIALVGIGMHRSAAVREKCEALYHAWREQGVEVLWDDRDERPGVIFADLDLIGIPHRYVLSDRTLAEGKIEYKNRRDTEAKLMSLEEAMKLHL